MQDNRNQLLTVRCVVCGKHVALRVDPEDVERHRNGVLAQDAFPYLPPALRELLISGTCPDCYAKLCPSNPLDYH